VHAHVRACERKSKREWIEERARKRERGAVAVCKINRAQENERTSERARERAKEVSQVHKKEGGSERGRAPTHVAHFGTLQHAATRCNTLQDTVTHCNTLDALQHNERDITRTEESRCRTLQQTATHCNTLRHTATHCNTRQHSVPLDVLQYVARITVCHCVLRRTKSGRRRERYSFVCVRVCVCVEVRANEIFLSEASRLI